MDSKCDQYKLVSNKKYVAVVPWSLPKYLRLMYHQKNFFIIPLGFMVLYVKAFFLLLDFFTTLFAYLQRFSVGHTRFMMHFCLHLIQLKHKWLNKIYLMKMKCCKILNPQG